MDRLIAVIKMPKRKIAISFGLVNIPAFMNRATKSHDMKFNLLCKKSGKRVRYKKVCPECENAGPEDLVKGYQYADDEYVVLTEEELEKIKSEKDKMINIYAFVKPDTIDPIYFDTSYFLSPQETGIKAFSLLYDALSSLKYWAVAKCVLTVKETLIVLRPYQGGFLMSTLFYHDELVEKEAIKLPKTDKKEVEMAKSLIKALVGKFEPEKYHDEYQKKLEKAVADKIAGKKIVRAKKTTARNGESLMAALRKSIEGLGGQA